MEGQSLDNPGTISITSVHGDTLTEEYIVGYAWKDSPWKIPGLSVLLRCMVYGVWCMGIL